MIQKHILSLSMEYQVGVSEGLRQWCIVDIVHCL